MVRRKPTRGELVSTRRALATLMRDGEITHLGTRHCHRHYWVRLGGEQDQP